MEQVFHIINEMSPYLLLGFLLAGMMHVFIPGTVYSRYLAGHSFRSVVYAALFGIPLPLCSCGVIPTAMSLRREGASKGAAVSFLIATPQTGIDSIIATYSLMGLPFAIVRPIAALATALFGGHMVNMADNKNQEETTHEHAHKTDEVASDGCGCGCGCHDHGSDHTSFTGKINAALRYAFLEMMEDIGKWLVVGLIVAGLITVFVPDSFFAVFKDSTALSMLLVLCIAIPMYICATGSIPIAVALMIKGLTPGAALVLLMAGPACNVASILVINKVLGRRTLIVYILSIVIGAILFGTGIDHLLPREWFTPNAINAACCHEDTSWFNIGCSILLFLLLVNALWHHYRHGSSCSCGHDHAHNHEHSCGCHDHNDKDCHCHDDSCHCHDDGCHCHDDDELLSFTVKGMNCSHCRSSVLGALQSLHGAEEVTVDLASGCCTVKGHASMEEAKQAVESLGFSLHK